MGNVAGVLGESSLEEKDTKTPDLVTKKLTHGCNLFVQNPSAREAFVEYVKKGTWVDKLSFSSPLLAKGVDIIGKTTEPDEDKPKLVTFNDYVLPDDPSPIQSGLENLNTLREQENLNSIIETCFSVSEMKSVLLAAVFPLFLESAEYEDWVEKNARESGQEIEKKPKSMEDQMKEMEDRENRLDELFQAQPQEKRMKEIVSNALTTVDDLEIKNMLLSGDWLNSLVAAVEDLPLCVTLATARQERRGFPLVYVNKAFENVTGYHRSDIIGKNCNFLQTDTSQKEQIAKMTAALRDAQPVKVALTNTRKDGSPFVNLLAMKPVFDSHGVYSYVIGVQYDVTQCTASAKELKLIDDLLAILPNMLK